jgi:hypothetical protein
VETASAGSAFQVEFVVTAFVLESLFKLLSAVSGLPIPSQWGLIHRIAVFP